MNHNPMFVDFISYDSGVYFLTEKFSAKIYRISKEKLIQKYKDGDVSISYLNNFN